MLIERTVRLVLAMRATVPETRFGALTALAAPIMTTANAQDVGVTVVIGRDDVEQGQTFAATGYARLGTAPRPSVASGAKTRAG